MTVIVDVSLAKSSKRRRVVLDDNDELLVGRQNEDVLLGPDQRLSRRHFSLRHVDGQVEIKHLSRTNPTLVAPDQSSDFQPVDDIRVEYDNCRIIAGSHRFVLTLEKAETLEQEMIPDIDPQSSWSDVDDSHHHPAPGNSLRETRPDTGPAPFSFDDSLDEREVQRQIARDAANDSSSRHRDIDAQPTSSGPAKPDQSKKRRPAKPELPADTSEPTIQSMPDLDDQDEQQETDRKPKRDARKSSGKSDPPDKKLFFPIDNFFED